MATLMVTFRYGQEEDEMMGLSLCKDLVLDETEIFPNGAPIQLTKEQVTNNSLILNKELTQPSRGPGSEAGQVKNRFS